MLDANFGTRSATAIGNSIIYTGRQIDWETGLFYYRNRHYHAQLGNFVSRDPLMYIGGPNAYRYVRNNPTRLLDPWGLVECNADNVGARRGVAGDTVFSPGNNSPDFVNGAMNFLIVLSAISDVPIPGVTDIGDLLNKLNPNSPWGIQIAEQLAKLKNFRTLLRLNAGQASVWTKVQCEECKCTNPILSSIPWIGATPTYGWKASGKAKWVQCDLSKTDWGKGENKKPASAVYVDSDVLFFDLLDLNEVANVKQQCAEQAAKSCEK
jgi:RHS repeat-associated protein